MEEIWKPIPDYEGIYEASSLGRIRTVPGKITQNARYPVRVWKSRIMKPKHPQSRKRKDDRISLWKDGKQHDYLVSRLVAAAWHGVPEPNMTVNHINGDWSDNRPDNLEWMSLSENIKSGFESGQFDSFCKTTVLQSSDGRVVQFRSKAEASRFLGRNAGYISNACIRHMRVVTSASGERWVIAE